MRIIEAKNAPFLTYTLYIIYNIHNNSYISSSEALKIKNMTKNFGSSVIFHTGFLPRGSSAISNSESGNSKLLGTGASPPESGNSILDQNTERLRSWAQSRVGAIPRSPF